MSYEDHINKVAVIFKQQNNFEENIAHPWWPITDLTVKICPIKDAGVKLSLGHALDQSVPSIVNRSVCLLASLVVEPFCENDEIVWVLDVHKSVL